MKNTFSLLFSIFLLVSCTPEVVEPDAAISISNRFYKFQSSGEIDSAMSLYDVSFKDDEHGWKKLLVGLHEKGGPVSNTELKTASLAAKESSPCFFLALLVVRPAGNTSEKLFICRSEDKSKWSIVGHEITRLDNNQVISSGIIPSMKTAL